MRCALSSVGPPHDALATCEPSNGQKHERKAHRAQPHPGLDMVGRNQRTSECPVLRSRISCVCALLYQMTTDAGAVHSLLSVFRDPRIALAWKRC